MTINVEALIRSLGKSYNEIFDAGLIPYKTKPKSSSGEPFVFLDMAKEGVFLSFKRDGRILKEMTVRIQNDKVKNWEFPNVLPSPLQENMSRQWMHENFGTPIRSAPPFVVMKREFGWTDLYEVKERPVPTSMQINYDTLDKVRSVTYMPTSELRW
ncbi:pyocin immunity protein [Hafnia alvei]|uniref:DUF6392 family protein n=1 Tax=Hafnia alvei TaxID=569 RepID=UPI000B6A9C85|nr:DUF6392 family protein [Hafnia alvei]MBI0274718.1 pyocin immunity protein [Hafnia alvei]PNK99247.1 pyocin immunity protein [Hafnia alvei]